MKERHENEENPKIKIIRIVVAAVLTAGLAVLKFTGAGIPKWAALAIAIAAYLTVGYDVLLSAAKGIVRGKMLDECFLMSVATIGAFVLGYLSGGDFFEAPAVMLFYQIGELFQDMAVEKSRDNIAALMDIRPDHANLIDEATGELSIVAPDTVRAGSLILVKPGEKIPIDGTVESGESAVDTAALTGESVPRTARPGTELLSGSVNLSAELRLRTTKEFGDSAVSRILELVENSEERKSRSENFIGRFARIYTPAVCAAAILLALVPPLLSVLILHSDPAWMTWLYRALAFLVASCPCALVVSIPLGFFASLGGAGREGILIKGSGFLEALSKTGTVVFDKTGTLTAGNFEVTAVSPVSISSEKLIELAALAEIDSSHPIGLSLIRAYGKTPDRSRVGNVREVSGKGVVAEVDGDEIAVGNTGLMDLLGISRYSGDFTDFSGLSPDISRSEDSRATVICVAVKGRFAGTVELSDRLKPTAKEAVSKLRDNGISRTVMLTGDREEVAASVAKETGIDEYHAELLPQDKVEKLEKIISRVSEKQDDCHGCGKVAFVGDGINDAPVLVRADIGIAMGGVGSDAAIEAADVVLMDDEPLKIPRAIGIARKCMKIIYENIAFSICVKLLTLIPVALGIGGMWLAIFADVGVMVLCVLNAIRALNSKHSG